MRLADWLPLLVFPGGLVILAAACVWLFAGLVRQSRNAEAAVTLVVLVGLACTIWIVFQLFIAS